MPVGRKPLLTVPQGLFLLALSALAPRGAFAAPGSDEAMSASVDPHRILERKIAFQGKTFEELSAYLYGGDVSRAGELRKLNPGDSVDATRTIRYHAPRVRASEGVTFQKLGALWAGGSAKSYFKILWLNKRIKHPDRLTAGQWIYLARIPTPEERKEWSAFWYAHNEDAAAPAGHGVAAREAEPAHEREALREAESSGAEAAVPAEPAREASRQVAEKTNACQPAELPAPHCEESIYAPRTHQERLAVVQWYLDHLDMQKDRVRADALVHDLLDDAEKNGATDWNPYYVAGQYYFRTGRVKQARAMFERALKDENAPIQVGLFFMRASEKEKRAVTNDERDMLFKGYSPLSNLLESERKSE